jgi:signal peptidase I
MNTSFASQETDAQSGNTQEYKTLIVYTVAALFIALVVRFFIAAPYVVSGASMDPSFETWDYLVIDKLTYHFEEPHRGEVVVFRYPYDPNRSFIKRVIGLPGETVILQGNTVIIKNTENPGGFIVDEPYIATINERPSDMTVTLGSDQYFVMGDNRRASADSRSWGALPRENIVGRAFVRLFPFSNIDLLPAQATYQ